MQTNRTFPVIVVVLLTLTVASAACGGDDADISSTTTIQATSPSDSTSTLPPTETKPEPTKTPVPPTATPTPVRALQLTETPYIGGTANVDLPAGEPGTISVVATGPYNGTILPVVLRNNSGKTAIRLKLSGRVRDSSGALIASGEDQGIDPRVVPPGGLAFGYVYFGGAKFDSSTSTVEIRADAETGVEEDYFKSLEITEVNLVGGQLIGIARNDSTKNVTGPISADVLCLTADGAVLSRQGTYADDDDLKPGQDTSFSINVRSSCPLYAVVSSGYYGR